MTATLPGAPETFATGGPVASPPGTLTGLFFEAVAKYNRPDALQYKAGAEWRSISHAVLAERVRHIARGLRAIGVNRGEQVAILSENRPEWALADYGCLTAGIADVPIYPTLIPEQIAYILRDSRSVAVFVSTEEQARKVAEIRASVPGVTHVIGFAEGLPGADLSLAQLEKKGADGETAGDIARYRAEALEVKPDDLATIIYTSGTTGEPKGTMLTHGNFHSNVQAVLSLVPMQHGDIALSFLPLSHSFERTVGHYLMHASGVSVAYAESVDALLANFGEVRPTIVVSVPRIYEKIYARVLENALSSGAIKKRIFFWARDVGDRWADEKLAGRTPGGLLAFKYSIAGKLVFSKLKARVGGRLRLFVSGGAPLAPEINKFFYSAGLTILEGYGLTETSPIISCNTPEHFRIGTVGRPLPGVDVKIASDGEILSRGPNIMLGYLNKPEATREAIDPEGWFHTGDIGELKDGFLRITDRKKDIIVTAGGKNIAPQPVENQAKMNKYVSQAVMIGDKRKFPVMLVVPNFESLEKWAKLKNLLWTNRAQLLAQPLVKAKIEKEVFGSLHGLANFEMPKKIALLDRDFSIEGGELTPTLKVKRRVIDQRHRTLVDSLYIDHGD
ncbi:MAG: long-chain fatty acid--CoA ligase [Anaerolineae bacterium]|nr:long-chain fatty acid--CoA ligase [Gemmatimonadaceae bacterium]